MAPGQLVNYIFTFKRTSCKQKEHLMWIYGLASRRDRARAKPRRGRKREERR